VQTDTITTKPKTKPDPKINHKNSQKEEDVYSNFSQLLTEKTHKTKVKYMRSHSRISRGNE
jgi:hypothetical protein